MGYSLTGGLRKTAVLFLMNSKINISSAVKAALLFCTISTLLTGCFFSRGEDRDEHRDRDRGEHYDHDRGDEHHDESR